MIRRLFLQYVFGLLGWGLIPKPDGQAVESMRPGPKEGTNIGKTIFRRENQNGEIKWVRVRMKELRQGDKFRVVATDDPSLNGYLYTAITSPYKKTGPSLPENTWSWGIDAEFEPIVLIPASDLREGTLDVAAPEYFG